MTTTDLIYNVEDSEGSVSSHQLRRRVRSCSLIQVLMGFLVVLMALVTGGVIWMNPFQDCPETMWTVTFTGVNTNFTSPSSQKYVIVGAIFTKGSNVPECDNSFRLLYGTERLEIMENNISEFFLVENVSLEKGSRLFVELNCDDGVEVNETSSFLRVFRQTN